MVHQDPDTQRGGGGGGEGGRERGRDSKEHFGKVWGIGGYGTHCSLCSVTMSAER